MTNISYTEVAKYPHAVTTTTQYNSDNEQKKQKHHQPIPKVDIVDSSKPSQISTSGKVHTSSYARAEVRHIGLAMANDDECSTEWKLTIWAVCSSDSA